MSGKVKYFNLSDYEKKKYLSDLYTMMALPKSRKEMKNFTKDLFTLSETVMFSRRIQVAKRLLKGESKIQIKEELRIGHDTIDHVEKWLKNGFGGYKNILERYQKFCDKQKKYRDIGEPGSFKRMRKNYPSHYWLLDMIIDRKK